MEGGREEVIIEVLGMKRCIRLTTCFLSSIHVGEILKCTNILQLFNLNAAAIASIELYTLYNNIYCTVWTCVQQQKISNDSQSIYSSRLYVHFYG